MESTSSIASNQSVAEAHYLGTWTRIYLHGIIAFVVLYAVAYVVTRLVPIFDFTGSRPLAISLSVLAIILVPPLVGSLILYGLFPLIGSVTGRKDIMDHLDFEVSQSLGREKVQHQGTYNANPVCASTGLAALQIVREEGACERATAHASALRDGINEVLAEEGVPWACYGEHSGFYLFLGAAGRDVDPRDFDPFEWSLADIKAGAGTSTARKLRLALLSHGVDISGKPGGLASGVHTDAEVTHTVAAMRASLRALRAEGELA